LLGAAADLIRDVEQGLAHNLAVSQNHDLAGLLDDKHPPGSIVRVDHLHGIAQSVDDELGREAESSRVEPGLLRPHGNTRDLG
jgi:hypothetical protein